MSYAYAVPEQKDACNVVNIRIGCDVHSRNTKCAISRPSETETGLGLRGAGPTDPAWLAKQLLGTRVKPRNLTS